MSAHPWRRAAVGALAAVVAALLAPSTAAPTAASAALASGSTQPLASCAQPAVNHVSCLNRFRSGAAARVAGVPRSAALAEGHVHPAADAVALPTAGYGPPDIADIYGLDTSGGAGSTVAVVAAFDNPNVEADLATFRAAWGLPACTSDDGCFRKVSQRGDDVLPEAQPSWGVEIDIDVQAVSSSCPRCRVLLVEADSSAIEDIDAAENQAVALGARIVSNSFGGYRFDSIPYAHLRAFSHWGVATVAASGDGGYSTAEFPASWYQVIAVGGTSVTRTDSGWAQQAWRGSGSGCSTWVLKPFWQTDPGCSHRSVVDLAALADPDRGLAIWDSYGMEGFGLAPGWLVVGGTSLATPLVAGMIGLAGHPWRLSTPGYLYGHRSSLIDIVGGSTGTCDPAYLCNGVVGYDGPTGLGTPYGLGAL